MQVKNEKEDIAELKKQITELTIAHSLLVQRITVIENTIKAQLIEQKHNVTPCNYNFFEPHNA